MTGVQTCALPIYCGTPSASDAVTVTLFPVPVIGITPGVSNGCNPVCTNFTATSSVPLSNVIWSFSNTTSATGVSTPNFCFSTPGIYSANILATDINNCQHSYSGNNLLTVYPVPIADFTSNPPSGTILNPEINFIDLSSGGNINSWSWNFGTIPASLSSNQNPEYTYLEPGEYNVWLVVTNSEGCIDSVNHPILIEPEFVFFAPNAFSPNNDGLNDFFGITGTGISTEGFELWIYDRWGNLIFNTNDILKTWDGKTPSGKEEIMQDVYVWKVSLKTWNGSKKNFVGHVTVLR